jgi:mono/diheme cytochrome c family protein
MKQHSENKARFFLPVKTITVMAIILSVIVITASAYKSKDNIVNDDMKSNVINADSVESAQAFLQVYKVLMSPRCMNCHPAGDRPLQGDDSHTHIMNVQRGKDGKGIYALKCSNCHQPENTPGLHTPPGNPKWQLPPADMKMVFQGRSAHDLALQIMDYNRNGHKNKEQLLEHARDTLVKIGWNMGEGRTPPPLQYDEFVKAWDTWINKGGYAPAKEN